MVPLTPSQVDLFMKAFIAACFASVFVLSWLLHRREEVAVFQPSTRAVTVELTNEQLLQRVLIILQRERVAVMPSTWSMKRWQAHQRGEGFAGTYDHENNVVWLSVDYGNDPWVLLQALAQRSLKLRGQSCARLDVNRTAREIATSILTPAEMTTVRWRMDIRLRVDA